MMKPGWHRGVLSGLMRRSGVALGRRLGTVVTRQLNRLPCDRLASVHRDDWESLWISDLLWICHIDAL